MNEEMLSSVVTTLDRIGMVLGALYASNLGGMEQSEKAERLKQCGYSNAQIAGLLGSNPESIRVGLYNLQRARGKARKAGKTKS